MKTTNNKHIINDKLQGVDIPDMDASWQKMEQTLAPVGPVQSGWSAFIAKYKLYLNLFIVATTIGFIGLYVKSKTHTSSSIQFQDTGLFTKQNVNYFTFQTTVDHTDDLPLPVAPVKEKSVPTWVNMNPELRTAISTPFEIIDTLEEIGLPEAIYGQEDTIQDTTVDVETVKVIMPINYITPPISYIHNQVGIKIQSGILPNYSSQNALRNTGFAFYVRRFINARSAIHVELGYNPIAISPTSYVERYNVFNNFNYTQTDSAVVKSLKYITIPINWHYQLRPDFSLTVGPQISFLTGLSGDVTRKMRYPTAPETDQLTENTSISNRGGFTNFDFGLNLEINLHVERFEVGFRVQQGLVDYSKDNLSTQTHRNSALQIKAACLLSR